MEFSEQASPSTDTERCPPRSRTPEASEVRASELQRTARCWLRSDGPHAEPSPGSQPRPRTPEGCEHRGQLCPDLHSLELVPAAVRQHGACHTLLGTPLPRSSLLSPHKPAAGRGCGGRPGFEKQLRQHRAGQGLAPLPSPRSARQIPQGLGLASGPDASALGSAGLNQPSEPRSFLEDPKLGRHESPGGS